MIPHDPLERVLYIDLSRRTSSIEHRPDLFETLLGGTGVASRLLLEECPEGVDPLSPEAPVILAVGPLTGHFPMASKTTALFKSPHTGNLGESHAGGRSAIALRMAGIGALVIKGSSDIPVLLVISPHKVSFLDARSLWGLEVGATGRALREVAGDSGLRSIIRIGPAGERLITYACAVTETYRHFGRLGLGAVLGAKKLKAIIISGRGSLKTADRRLYRETYEEIFQKITRTDSLKKYHDLGTAVNILPLNQLGALPTYNLQKTSFEMAEKISGEYLAQRLLGRRLACAHCPVACIHLAALRTPYEDEAYFYKTTFISYDYELLYSLGSMIGIGQAEEVLRLLHRIDNLGLDAMSTGVVLAWATEAFKRGLVTTRETEGLEPDWGKTEIFLEMISALVQQKNDFYRALGRGVDYASSQYGGQEFALAFGGNEMPGYHTGPAAHLTHLTGARHSHLDSGGYSLDEKEETLQKTPQELAEHLFREESFRQILSSLVVCFFARSIYGYETAPRALTTVGFNLSPEELRELGQKILKTKYRFKLREGFSFKDLRIPRRILETVSARGKIPEAFLREGLKIYAQLVS